MELNQQQVAGWLRAALAAGGPIGAIVLSKSGISAADWAMYVELALVIIPPIAVGFWSWYRNKKSTQAKIVSQVDGLQVHADPAVAPPEVVAAARSEDPTMKDVVLMEGGPVTEKATGEPPAADAEKV